MSTENTALALALAALGQGGTGGGGQPTTVSVKIADTITGEAGTKASVLNIGTDTEVNLQFTIPEGKAGQNGIDGKDGENGKDGKAGSRWYSSTGKAGTDIPEGMVDGDFVLYSNGSIYSLVNGNLVKSNVSLAGSNWIVMNTLPTGIAPVGAKEGDCLLYSDCSVWRITGGRTVNTGVNLRGLQGVSPSITVKENTDDSYVLTIVTAEGSFDTPNLKGQGTTGEGVSPYEYAKDNGYTGTEEDFKKAYMNAIGITNNDDVVIDGGVL